MTQPKLPKSLEKMRDEMYGDPVGSMRHEAFAAGALGALTQVEKLAEAITKHLYFKHEDAILIEALAEWNAFKGVKK